ncbi:transcriptional repressor [Cerasibacillus terrae]|uniref:Transcriptional repressor n=1 Tax=Cerasibacillus terrae TaxID=2498845 RepID=A0A5C8NV82_9BACI|nr:Fur family transcriptional regulator [Cerasibacillus terrae]TXL64950.1 transcriptional repressor [Cerasibacillus terrae]
MSLKESLDILKENGYKMTKRREEILHFFQKEDKYKTAKDLYEYMESIYEGISYDTVYRNLHLYHKLGILESTELNSEKHFRLSCSEHHHHHFICKDCGTTREINVCPMNDVGNMLHNYQIDGHKFEIYGLCPACQ